MNPKDDFYLRQHDSDADPKGPFALIEIREMARSGRLSSGQSIASVTRGTRPTEDDFVSAEDLGLIGSNTQSVRSRRGGADNSLLTGRYHDAYQIARAIIGQGSALKVLAFVLGGLAVLLGVLAADELGEVALFAGGILGIAIGLPIYQLGVLISAQGQLLIATLDTAVNTSPLLSETEQREILGV